MKNALGATGSFHDFFS